MSEHLFTKDQVKALKRNINVLAVNQLGITYTFDFKLRYMEEYIKGRLPIKIFVESGFDQKIIDINLIKSIKKASKEAF